MAVMIRVALQEPRKQCYEDNDMAKDGVFGIRVEFVDVRKLEISWISRNLRGIIEKPWKTNNL